MFNTLFGRPKKGYHPAPVTDLEDVKMGMLSPNSRSSQEIAERPKMYPERPRASCCPRIILLVYTLLTLVNLAIVGFLFASHNLRWNLRLERNYHQRATSMHSPLFDLVDLEITTQTWDGNLFTTTQSSIFRQPPSPDVDAAWEHIADIKTFLVDRSDIEKVGKDPMTAVKAPASWNVGEKYLAQLDGPHQLHCLNELRKQVYADYYYGPEGYAHPLHWVHMAHCLDIVRQSLVCASSVDLLTFNFVETQQGPYYDFNAQHKCRNHEAILSWVDAHAIDWDKNGNITKPDDYEELPIEEEYYRYVPALTAYYEKHNISAFFDSPQGHSHHGR